MIVDIDTIEINLSGCSVESVEDLESANVWIGGGLGTPKFGFLPNALTT